MPEPTAQIHVPTIAPAPTPLLKNLSFQLLWTSVAAAGFGDRLVQLGALSMLGIHKPEAQAASIQASVTFFFFLPYVLLGSLAGWLADTLPRRWILLTCDEVRAGILVLAAMMVPAGAAIAIPPEYHWKVYAIIAAAGCCAAIFSPAKAATVPQVVPAEQLQPANAIVLGIAVIASLIGVVAGGPIVAKYSVRAGLFLGAAAFAISGLFFLGLRIRPHTRTAGEQGSQLQRMWQAVRYTVKHRAVFQLTALAVLFWAGAYVISAAIAALCKTRFNVADEDMVTATGYMMGALGGGMLLSSGWVAWINTRRESGWFAMGMLLLTGFAMIGLAFSPVYGFGLAMAALTGFFGNTAMICVATLTQSIAPDYVRGRVFGVRDIATNISAIVINFIIWQTPHADEHMFGALIGTALILAAVGANGLYTGLTTGPMPRRFLNFLWRISRSFTLVWHRVRWIGRHNVPRTGPVILAANHTTGLDPFIMQGGVCRPVRWLMAQAYRFRVLEFFWSAIEPVCISENTHQLGQMRQLLAVLAKGEIIGLFPEGKLQRDSRELAPFQSGLAMLAVRSKATIVPVWISGTPRTKSMLWHFLKPSRSMVIYGEPFRPDPNQDYDAIMTDLRDRLLALKAEVEQRYHS